MEHDDLSAHWLERIAAAAQNTSGNSSNFAGLSGGSGGWW